jgi:ABC-type sugar transport system substrate-binding protein
MKTRLFSVCILVVGLALVLTWTVTAQQPPKSGSTSSGEGLEVRTIPAITLGQPGTSFRYVQTFGVTEEPYSADALHLNHPNGIFVDGGDNAHFSSWYPGPQSVAIDTSGRVYVADAGNYRIQIVSSNGVYSATFGSYGDGPYRFGEPAGIGYAQAAVENQASKVTLASPALTGSLLPSSPTNIQATSTFTYTDMVVGFLQAASVSEWGTANTNSFINTASQLGITLVYSDANNDVNIQRADFQRLIDDPAINVIVLRAADGDGWDTLLQAAQVASKTVVLEDRAVSSSDSLYATRVSPDFEEEGRRAGTAMCNLLAGSPSKNVVEVAGTVGSAPAIDRAAGFREIAATCGISITQSASGDFIRAEGQLVMAGFLSTTHNIQGVYAHNDDMGLGAIRAIKDAGLKAGDDIKVVSIDAVATAFRAMIVGDLNVTVECSPLLAPQVYSAALDALNGITLPKWIASSEGVYSQTTAAAVYPTRYDWVPPSLGVDVTKNEVYGYDWPLGVPVTLTVNDLSNGPGIDYTAVQTVAAASWDPYQFWVYFDPGAFALAAGQVVTLTDGTYTRTRTVLDYADMHAGFLQAASVGEWETANTNSFINTASQLGITLVYSNANYDVNIQRADFQRLIDDPAINAIVLRAADWGGWDALLQAAQVASKTVVLEDRGIGANSSLYATRISSDFEEEGRRAGTAMCNLLAGSPSKNVVEVAGTVGSAPAIGRAAGFREIAATCGISITQSATADFIRAEGQLVMAGFLSTTHNIQGVYAHNDDMGLGAIQAIKDAGLKAGDDIKVVSIDALADAFVAMIAGDLNVTVECNPLLAPQVYTAALQALNGVYLPKWIPIDEDVFYQADAGAVYPTRYDYYPTSLTSVLLAASPNPATLGANVLLTGTVNAAGAPTGTVQFYRDGVALGGAQALSGKVATYTTSTLSAGAHVITATYSGDGYFQAGVSAKFSVMVVHYSTPPINPGTPATAVFTAPTSVPQAVTVTVQIPAGALMDTVNLAYTAEPVSHSAPANFNFAGAGFNLSAYTDNVLQTGICFAVPVTLTLSYDPASLGSLHADELELRYWNGSAWVSDGITVIGRDTVAHQVTVTIMHLTDFALMGPSSRFIYLPLVQR